MIARTTPGAALVVPMGNYVSDRVGNYVSVRPLSLGNYVSADTLADGLAHGGQLGQRLGAGGDAGPAVHPERHGAPRNDRQWCRNSRTRNPLAIKRCRK